MKQKRPPRSNLKKSPGYTFHLFYIRLRNKILEDVKFPRGLVKQLQLSTALHHDSIKAPKTSCTSYRIQLTSYFASTIRIRFRPHK